MFLLGSLLFYIFFQSKSIFGADAGDLVAAAATRGFPHPPGFPLYTLIASFLIHISAIITPAWRVALISSVSSALTLTYLYKFSQLFFKKNKLFIILGLIFYGSTYLYWQYSTVAEVFSLNTLFATLVIYYFLSFILKNKKKYLFLALLFFSLGVFHHQTIVLILPGLIYLYFVNKRKFKLKFKDYLLILLLLILGFIPYLILFFTANYSSPASWFGRKNILDLPAMFLRSEYGTFRASANIADAYVSRIFQIFSYFYLIIEDFWVATPLVVLGAINQYKKNRDLFYCLILMFFTAGPLFAFYSSFITVNPFMVGTYERFLLFSYPFLAIWLIWGIQKLADNRLLTLIVLLVMIFLNLNKNLELFLNLRNDFTADNVAKDLLDSVDQNGILFVKDDIPIFNSEYVAYALNYKKATIIPYMFLFKTSFHNYLKNNYPGIKIPDTSSQEEFIEKFMKLNSGQIAIYANFALRPEGLYWVPNGLVWRVYASEDKIPSNEEIIKINKTLWEHYHDPLLGVLKTKRILIMDQILDIYAQGRQNNSWAFMQAGFNNESLESLRQAWKLRPDNDKTKLFFANNYLNLEDCVQAEIWFSKINSDNMVASENKEFYISIKNHLTEKCGNQ